MKRSKGRIYISAFLAVVILVFGYVGWRLGTAKSVTNNVKNAYLRTFVVKSTSTTVASQIHK